MPKQKKTSFTFERATLDNGLRVVFAPDRSSPTVMVATYYDVGFRSEPEGRTGFAHLFEHLMFQGSATLEKGVLDEVVGANGGILNGSTRNDFTNYFEVMPSNALELTLFLQADRMRGLALTPESLRNQIDVVKEEIRLNVNNQPFGGFPWLWLPMVLFETFPNAHDAYGHFDDLEAATMDDAAEFFERYYAPGNCVLSVTGDVDPDKALAMVERHFGDIPARAVPPALDASEKVPTGERRQIRYDALAPQPGLALGYRVPDPIAEFDAYCASILAARVLTAGSASRLHERLVKTDRIANHVEGEVGLVAGAFEVRGPSMMQVMVLYPGDPDPDRITPAIDDEIATIGDGIETEELDRVRSAAIAEHLRAVDSLMERGMLVSAIEQQRGRAEVLNEIPERLAAVTPDDIARIAREWLQPHQRALLDYRPGGAA